MQYAIDHPDNLASLTLIDTLSPFGYGGTKDAQGSLCWPDGAGSGGGTANPDYVQRLKAGDRSEESPNSPRNVLNAFYFKPPFRAEPSREEVYLDEILRMVIGDDNYPGDGAASPNWPGVGPGQRGVNNAMSPLVCNVSAFASISPQPCRAVDSRRRRSDRLRRLTARLRDAGATWAMCLAGRASMSFPRSRWLRRYAPYSIAIGRRAEATKRR